VKRATAAFFLFLTVAAAAGCGGSAGTREELYAGMTLSDARGAALQQSQSQTTDAADPLFGHHLRLLGVTKGRDLTGDPAWQAAFRDFSDYRKPRLCIWFADGQYSGGVVTLQFCPKKR
jgi:hypothetical protein